MNKFIRRIERKLVNFGFDFRKFLKAFKKNNEKVWFYRDLEELKKQRGIDETFPITKMYPILHEREEAGGTMKGAYFHQDLYVAKLINQANPTKHLDIGSRTDGFVAHVAAFREIELIDFRTIESNVGNIVFRKADLMQLPKDLINYCDSISSLHAIEHFGLGRYGDPIDYFGHLKAIDNITKILKKGGIFYFSVPMGSQRIEFNAHRIFSIKYLIEILSNNFQIKTFSYVDDEGDLFENQKLTEENINTNFNCNHGCAIFSLVKK